MKKSVKWNGLVLSLLMAIALLMQPASIYADNSEIDNYIASLSYNPTEILKSNGEKYENILPRESQFKDGKFVVVTREKKQISNASSDISIMNSTSNKIYPGTLLLADNKLVENNPTILSVARAPMTLSVDLPGLTGGRNSVVVERPSKSATQSAINELLDTWNTEASKNYPNIPARLQYTETMAYDMNQLKVKFGTSFEKLSVPLNIDFSAIHSGEKQTQIVNFKQIYYTVSMDTPMNPSSVFDAFVSKQDLINRGVSNETPPVYVSDVSYGRSMYIKLETNSKNTEVKNAFAAAIKGVDISQNSEYQNILNNTSFSAIILGGEAGQSSKVVHGNINDLKQLIQDGANYDRTNPGVPISYSTSFLKDNKQAIIQNHSDYIETKASSYDQGVLTLHHKGAYVIRYNITWDEISHDDKGNEVVIKREWKKNHDRLTAGFRTSIPLKGNVRNLKVEIEGATGLVWEPWRTSYEKENLTLHKELVLVNSGTTLNQKVTEVVE